MERILGAWRDEAYVLMRFMMGFMLTCHGVQKLFGLLEGEGHPQGIWLIAGVLESVGGSLLMLGLFTSPVAFLLSGEMAVAYFMTHAPFRFLADSEWRRNCRRQLLCFSLYRSKRRWNIKRG